MRLEQTSGPAIVQHYNGYPTAEINGGPAPGFSSGQAEAALAAIADLIGSVEGLPADLSARRKWYLKTTGYGENRTG